MEGVLWDGVLHDNFTGIRKTFVHLTWVMAEGGQMQRASLLYFISM